MTEKKGFWASLLGGSGCSCGLSIEEEKADGKKPAKEKDGCCGMQRSEKPSCTCGEAESPQAESACGCGITEEKAHSAVHSNCCGGNK